jgi:glycosyltransferase involved in cell wall biosynthesis
MPKVVAILPVRNEEWILEKTLTDLSTYIDEIVVVDDGSTDRTPEIIRSFKRVTQIFTNPPGTLPFNNGCESDNRNKTLQLARHRKADWVLQIDADEIFEDHIRLELPALIAKGYSTKFQICHFWNDIDHFRVDGDWGSFCRYRLFKMRDRLRYSPQHIIATPRAFDRKNRQKSDIKILHYGWLNTGIRKKHLERYFEVYKIKHPETQATFEEFANSTEMQEDLKIVRQDEGGAQTATWQEIMGKTSQEKYKL